MASTTTLSKRPRAAATRVKAPAPAKRNRAGRPTTAELDRRKLRVMVVATEMFVARGYAATTLLEIAKQAGVATRTVYQHFGDKDELFREVIFARNTAIIDPPVLADGEDLMAALRKAAQYSYEIALRPRSIDLMRLMIAESARFPELMTKVATTIFKVFTGNVALLFNQLADKGLIAQGDHNQSAQLFVDLMLGNQTVMIYFGWLSSVPTEQDIEVKLDLFVKGRFGGFVPDKPASKSAAKPVGELGSVISPNDSPFPSQG